jgi:hypothetical protein
MLASQEQHQALSPQQVVAHKVAPLVITSQPQAIPFARSQLYYLEKVE